MGNRSGASALSACWDIVKGIIPEDKKREVADEMIKAFWHMDFHPAYACPEVWLAAGHLIDTEDDD
jgi:hypothetical protein